MSNHKKHTLTALAATVALITATAIGGTAFAAKDCDEIKGNIVGKLFCKAKSNYGSESSSSSISSEASNSTEEESTGWKLWKKPEWMKKKN